MYILRSGLIDLEQFEAALRPDTSLVTEIGCGYKYFSFTSTGECDDGEQ